MTTPNRIPDLDCPDPDPSEPGIKRLDKLRSTVPTLIRALITGRPLPGEVVPRGPKPVTRPQRRQAPQPRPPADIVILTVPDPDTPNRTIRREHRVDRLWSILGDKTPDVRKWPQDGRTRYEAAERLRDDWCMAQSPSAANDGAAGHTSSHPGRYGFPDAVVDALTRYREAERAIPVLCLPIVRHVVIERGTLGTVTLHARHHRRKAALLDGLDALVRHYEGCDG